MTTRALPHRDHASKVLWVAVLGVTLLVTACGGGDSEESGLAVSSPDGMATLVIAEGSLPDGISIDDIEIEWTEVQSDEPGTPSAAVRLSPSGLKLSQTASLYVDIPGDTDQLLVVHVSGGGFEFASLSAPPPSGGLDVTIDVSHFSLFLAYGIDAFAVAESLVPDSVLEGNSWSVGLQIDLVKPTFPIWVPIGEDETLLEDVYENETEWRLLEYEIDGESMSAGYGLAEWRAFRDGKYTTGLWDPVAVAMTPGRQGTTLTVTALSRCEQANDGVAELNASISVTARLANIGEIVDGATLRLSSALGGVTNQAVADTGLPDIGDSEAADIELGRHILQAPCVGAPAGDTTSSSSTSSTSPAGQGSGSTSDLVDDPVGDLVQAFTDLDRIDPERTDGEVSGAEFVAAVDFVEMEVTSTRSTDSTTVISLKFSGPAELMPTETSGNLTSREFGMDIIIKPPTGRTLDVIFDSDGKIKISDIPEGMSITSEWIAPDELRIVIDGLSLDEGTQIDANLLLEAYGGIMSDTVSLTVGG